ncbi:hypothetical protein AKJ35_00310 [candidate division MSBL1 archaeon SCGC-AAA833F18]|nr:hypothetical protein AKJ42_00820 [candidate division MSBL1 archaeon SCGC-AAA261C02]KXB03976.1 hypothetical protein AKJ48_03505 [candidate division MSBL1 archaeon SCGC-AAA261O19]KXB09684.1 hypothetical protein AKJ35_00310 [candidate division MSBL1 archaeon SCGC-AAA833F18]
MAKLIVTSRGLEAAPQTLRVIKDAFPDAEVGRTGFRGVITMDAEGYALKLAEHVYQECFVDIGRAVAIFSEVESTREEVEEAAVRIGEENIERGESFCFRLYKRGSHQFEKDTPELEEKIGGAIWEVLEGKHGEEPEVDLETPSVTIDAEVLGSKTAVGVLRREWEVDVA